MCIIQSDVLNIDLEGIRGDDLLAELIETFASVGNVFTSSVIVQVEGELLIFIGTRNGVLLKVCINQNYMIEMRLIHILVYLCKPELQ